MVCCDGVTTTSAILMMRRRGERISVGSVQLNECDLGGRLAKTT